MYTYPLLAVKTNFDNKDNYCFNLQRELVILTSDLLENNALGNIED